MDFKHCTLDIDEQIGTLSLNHPEVLNSVSPDMLGGLHDAITEIENSRGEIRCVVITGKGRAFCTGANLQGRNDPKYKPVGPLNSVHILEWGWHPLLRRLRDLHCPLIASVNGVAAGAGMSLALMADLIVAARSAYFMQAFRRVGLVPDSGSTWTLPRRIGKTRAIELSLLGERLPAEKALDWGLVNRVYDDAELSAETRKLALDLATGPTIALGNIRKLYAKSSDNSFEEQLDLEVRTQVAVRTAKDYKEGVLAFLEKRPAKFTGQ